MRKIRQKNGCHIQSNDQNSIIKYLWVLRCSFSHIDILSLFTYVHARFISFVSLKGKAGGERTFSLEMENSILTVCVVLHLMKELICAEVGIRFYHLRNWFGLFKELNLADLGIDSCWYRIHFVRFAGKSS